MPPARPIHLVQEFQTLMTVEIYPKEQTARAHHSKTSHWNITHRTRTKRSPFTSCIILPDPGIESHIDRCRVISMPSRVEGLNRASSQRPIHHVPRYQATRSLKATPLCIHQQEWQARRVVPMKKLPIRQAEPTILTSQFIHHMARARVHMTTCARSPLMKLLSPTFSQQTRYSRCE